MLLPGSAGSGMVGQTCRTGYFRAGEPREPRQGPSPQRSKPSSASSLAQLPAAQPASQGWALTKNLGSRPLWLLKDPQGFTLMLPQEQSCAKRALWPCPGCPAGCPRSRQGLLCMGMAWLGRQAVTRPEAATTPLDLKRPSGSHTWQACQILPS